MIPAREPALPLHLTLDDGRQIVLHTLLRALPGKRLTGIGTVAGEAVLAKLFIAPGSAHRHWERECRGLAALCDRAIPTPARLSAGPLANGAGHYLLTAYLAAARTPSAEAPADLHRVFGLLGRLHAAGLVQRDAHLGNFLLDGEQAWVIDGDAVHPATGPDDLLRNLALLFAQWPEEESGQYPEGNPVGRNDLLTTYAAAGGTMPASTQLAAAIGAARNTRLADSLKKCLRECTGFHVERRWNRFVAMPRPEAEFLAPIVADPDAWLARGTPLKQGRTATLALVEHAGRQLVLKRYNLKSAGHALSRAWRPSRAWHSWLAAHRLEFLGIATPKPLALIENRCGPLRGRAWLVTEYCPGQSLADLSKTQIAPDAAQCEAIGKLFRHLAAARIAHGDLKATNLLWHDGSLHLIDLDALRACASPAAFARAWHKECARFLRNWPTGSAWHKECAALLREIGPG